VRDARLSSARRRVGSSAGSEPNIEGARRVDVGVEPVPRHVAAKRQSGHAIQNGFLDGTVAAKMTVGTDTAPTSSTRPPSWRERIGVERVGKRGRFIGEPRRFRCRISVNIVGSHR
jgi:hypothetical protein